jgi:glycine cleavage system transcriptional repressor
MRQYLVVSAVGQDRPGIVDRISSFILDHDCNIEDSRMAILGGEFALIVLVAGEPDRISRLQAEAGEFGQQSGLTLFTKATTAPGARAAKGARRFSVHAVGLDHEGIVHEIAHALAKLGVNIEALASSTVPAPHTGAPQFVLDLQLETPPQLPEEQFREKLTAACEAVNVDVEIKPLE